MAVKIFSMLMVLAFASPARAVSYKITKVTGMGNGNYALSLSNGRMLSPSRAELGALMKLTGQSNPLMLAGQSFSSVYTEPTDALDELRIRDLKGSQYKPPTGAQVFDRMADDVGSLLTAPCPDYLNEIDSGARGAGMALFFSPNDWNVKPEKLKAFLERAARKSGGKLTFEPAASREFDGFIEPSSEFILVKEKGAFKPIAKLKIGSGHAGFQCSKERSVIERVTIPEPKPAGADTSN